MTDIKRQMTKIVKEQIKEETEIERRMLNAISKKEATTMAREVRDQTGLPVGAITAFAGNILLLNTLILFPAIASFVP